ncbi:tyrosine-type recombinase/integrase [Noviherbaspirillum malthae]|uniref:tyrosine-type recombinase/integrase n=1 Tax=Noviherbaspirillum malthae TaxID=1260987 RepID=UPI00188E8B23|nr:integrase arm-type DNA-binding domain-containing protein [Noviherbaspirillum malthae]
MKLTATECKNAKPKEKAYKLADGGGMFLLIQPNGARYWRMKYRYAGKEKLLALGVFPEVTLSEARQKRDAARKLLDAGEDPSATRREQKRQDLARTEQTFERIAREWHKKGSADWSAGYAAKIMDSLEQNVFPSIGRRPIDEISAKEMLDLLTKIEARGALEIASRVKQRCSAVFDYAITKLLTRYNPTHPLRGSFAAPKNKNYARLSIAEMPEFMRKLAEYDGRKVTALAIRFMAYTFVRTGELRGAEWNEIDFEGALWRIPAERMKMKEQHLVPLSSQAIAILRELKTFTGDGRLVFPGDRNANKPMSENTVLYAIYRMGYRTRMTGHGFRGIASTALNEMGYRPDVIERQLAHSERDGVRAAYNHAQYLPERITMMQHWADYLDAIAAGNKVIAGKFGQAA